MTTTDQHTQDIDKLPLTDRGNALYADFLVIVEQARRDGTISPMTAADVITAARSLKDASREQERARCLGLTRNLSSGHFDGARDLYRAIEDGDEPEEEL